MLYQLANRPANLFLSYFSASFSPPPIWSVAALFQKIAWPGLFVRVVHVIHPAGCDRDNTTVWSSLMTVAAKYPLPVAGQGVVIDVTKADIDQVKDPENWILQRKVKYADVIRTPDNDAAKAEIRIFYFWKEGATRPIAVNNLARLSKGKMIGVRYNKDKTWVGGSLVYFEQ